MDVTTTFAAKLDAADGTYDVSVAFNLVDQQTLFIFKVLIASLAVLMSRIMSFVLLHLVDGGEELSAVAIGARHLAASHDSRHDRDGMSRGEASTADLERDRDGGS